MRGYVQGVGFRWWVRARALERGLVGSASNLRDGRVEINAEGSEAACHALIECVEHGDTPGQVDGITVRWSAARGGLSGFVER